MELNITGPVTTNGDTNITNEVKLQLPVTTQLNSLTSSDFKPEDTDTLRELLTYPDLIPFIPVLMVLIVVLAMTTIKYVLHALKMKSLLRMPRDE